MAVRIRSARTREKRGRRGSQKRIVVSTKKPVVVLLEDLEDRAVWLAQTGQKLGFTVWWTRNVQDFHQFIFDAQREKRLFLVVMDHDLGHKNGRDGRGEDGTDAATDMEDVGDTPILLWSHNQKAVARMLGILKNHKTEGHVRVIKYTELHQKALSGVVHAALLTFTQNRKNKTLWN